ncbi:hypothetical protein ABWK46_00860 [Peribacillus frigoritolerans]
MEGKVQGSCGNTSAGENIAGANAEEAPRTARGKRVPAVEVNGQLPNSKKTVDQLDEVCLQYEINNRNKKTMYSIS